MITRFKRLHIYLIISILKPFIGAFISFSFICIIFQVLELSGKFILYDTPFLLIVKMLSLKFLALVNLVLPSSFLLSTLIAFRKLSSENEITAMRTCGASILNISLTGGIMAISLCLLSLILNMEWIPWGDRNFRLTFLKIIKTNVVSSIQAGTFKDSGFFGLVIYADKIDTKTDEMQNIFIQDKSKKDLPITIIAKAGKILPVETESSLQSAMILELYNGNIYNSSKGVRQDRIKFKNYKMYLKTEEAIGPSSTNRAKSQSYKKLIERIKSYKMQRNMKKTLISYKTEFWRRLALAFSSVVFLFIGISYGIKHSRSSRSSPMLITMITIFIYWCLHLIAIRFSLHGKFPPNIAAHVPNTLFLIFGIKAYLNISKV